ncbi:hypothetical protein ACEQPO_25335 [Bacillus sp. SL00103]
MMTTVHSYTNDQQILDLPHKDYRRARAPRKTSSQLLQVFESCFALVLPELKGKKRWRYACSNT